MITSTTLSKLLAPGLKKVAFDEYNKVTNQWSKIFNMNKSTKAYEEWTAVTGVGLPPEKPEGEAISFADFQVLTPKRITHVMYSLGMRATMEAKMYEQFGIMKRWAKCLGRSHGVRRHIDMANIFNGGFNTAVGTGTTYAGLPLFSASHPIAAGARYAPDTTNITSGAAANFVKTTLTASNLLTAADLDYTSLQDMLTLFMRQVDYQGDYVTFPPKYLWCSVENSWIAKELLRSSTRPDTANRSDSSISDLGLELFTDNYLLDTDAWGLIADKENHDLQFFEALAPTTESHDDFETGDTLIKMTQGYSLGFHYWLGVTATTGA